VQVLPKGVHFVHTKQFGENTSNKEAASNDTSIDTVVFVFRIFKEEAVDDMNKIHSDKTLSSHIKKVLDLKSYATDINSLDLEVLYQENDYQEIKKILCSQGTISTLSQIFIHLLLFLTIFW